MIASMPEVQLEAILSGALKGFNRGNSTASVMRDFERGLEEARLNTEPSKWKNQFVPTIRRHSVMSHLLQDPLTKHSFERPRGYPGDAALLDLIYCDDESAHQVANISELGQEIFAYTANVPASEAVRERKSLIAKEIDAAIQRKPKARILSVACGHLREIGMTHSIRDSAFEEFVAMDQDPRSLQAVEEKWSNHGVRPVRGTVSGLIRGNLRLGRFDLIYSAGLYDYLNTRAAVRLSAVLFKLLNEGGVLLISNFLPAILETGYMEAIMDWWLIRRSPNEIESLAAEMPDSDVSIKVVSLDSHNRIGYLRIIRK